MKEVEVFLDGVLVGRASASVSTDRVTCELRLDVEAEIALSELPHNQTNAVITLRFPADVGERHFQWTEIHENMVTGVLM